ncbi:hypothetical protein TNCV_4297091 [Trichonephila clavipes]|nr:hypothetical protein TNCV_4297091 [Trichonephila clavipes]
MVSPQEQAQAVAWFVEFKSTTHVQRKWGSTTMKFGNKKKLPGRWMERGSSITWLSRSLDVTPSDFL